MELFKQSESYLLGVHRTKRRSVYSSDQELVQTCSLTVKHKKTQGEAERQSVVIGCSDGNIVIWKPGDFKADMTRSNLKEHLGTIFQLVYVKETQNPRTPGLLLSCSADRTIRVWDPWDRDLKNPCVQSLTGHGGSVKSIAYAKDYLLSCSLDKTIRVWRSSAVREVLLYPWYETVQCIEVGSRLLRHPPVSVNSIQRTEATSFYIGDEKGNLYTYLCPPTKEGQFTLIKDPHRIHKLSITVIVVVMRENFVITLSFDDTAQVHDALSGNRLFAIHNPNRCRYTSACWDRKQQELMLGDEQGHIQFWNIYGERCNHSLLITQFGDKLNNITLQAENKLMLGTPAGVETWHIAREELCKEFRGHSGPIVGLLYVTLQDQHLYSSSLDNSIRCWDPYDMSCLGAFREKRAEISCMTYLPGSIVIITGHDDGNIKLWNIDSGSSMTLEHHANTVSCMTIARSRKRDFLISGSFDKTVGIWDISKRRAFNPLPEHALQVSESEILAVCFDPHHDTFVTAGNDKCVRLWDLWTHECKGVLRGHMDAVTCLAIDGNFVISGSDDNTINVWDSRLKFLVKTLSGHTMAVRDLLVITKVGLVVSCSYDGQILVWDYITGEIRKKFGNKKEFRCLLYNQTDSTILAGTDHCGIMIFQLPPELLTIMPLNFARASKHLEKTSQSFINLLAESALPKPSSGDGVSGSW